MYDMSRTAQPHPMKNDGNWAKIGDKTYRHVSGTVVRYDHMQWMWIVEGTGYGYKTLTAAKYNAEKVAA